MKFTSDDWCKGIEKQLQNVENRLSVIETQNSRLIQVVTLGLLAIVGAIVGVKLLP